MLSRLRGLLRAQIFFMAGRHTDIQPACLTAPAVQVVALPPAKDGSSGRDLRGAGGVVPSSERRRAAAAGATKTDAAGRTAKQPWRAVLEWGLRGGKLQPPSPPLRGASGGGTEWALARDRARLERALLLRPPEDKKQHHRAFQELLEEMRRAAERSLAASVEEGGGSGGGAEGGGGGGEEAEGSDRA